MEPSTTASSSFLESFFSMLVIQFALLFVAQHLIGLADLLEFLLGTRAVVRIFVLKEAQCMQNTGRVSRDATCAKWPYASVTR
jgi:hypothetical protein